MASRQRTRRASHVKASLRKSVSGVSAASTKSPPSSISAPDLNELCNRLEDVFKRLDLIQDVLIVCKAAAAASSEDGLHSEIESVLRVHVGNPLFGQLKELNLIIVGLGGRTRMSEDVDAEDDQ